MLFLILSMFIYIKEMYVRDKFTPEFIDELEDLYKTAKYGNYRIL